MPNSTGLRPASGSPEMNDASMARIMASLQELEDHARRSKANTEEIVDLINKLRARVIQLYPKREQNSTANGSQRPSVP